MILRTRFAPSPTGDLHLGHAVHILHVFGIARALGATVQLRLEDHDQSRCRPEYAASIRADLRWLGLVHGDEQWRIQSEHRDEYTSMLDRLRLEGLLYACSCSRKDLAARRAKQGLPLFPGEVPYDGYCRERQLPLSSGHAIRLRLTDEAQVADDLRLGQLRQIPIQQCGDFPLMDNKGGFTYQFCVVVDDLLNGTNLVIRGEDILPSTGRQLALLHRLGGKPPLYYHHPLVYGETGEKLSKKFRSFSLQALRESGVQPAQLLGMAARAAGLTEDDAPLPIEEIGALFSSLSAS